MGIQNMKTVWYAKSNLLKFYYIYFIKQIRCLFDIGPLRSKIAKYDEDFQTTGRISNLAQSILCYVKFNFVQIKSLTLFNGETTAK